jgi:hypothetical protein
MLSSEQVFVLVLVLVLEDRSHFFHILKFNKNLCFEICILV